MLGARPKSDALHTAVSPSYSTCEEGSGLQCMAGANEVSWQGLLTGLAGRAQVSGMACSAQQRRQQAVAGEGGGLRNARLAE